MSEKIIELLKTIETLNTEDLEKVGAWVDFNLKKRNSECCEIPFSNDHIHS